MATDGDPPPGTSRKSNTSQSDTQERRSVWDPNDSFGSRERTSQSLARSNGREMLHNLVDQYHAEKRRADDAERTLQELLNHLKDINDARLQAIHDATKANEELKLYKIQLISAQNEIYRAQDIIEVVDRQRYNAEKEAAKFRSKARQLNETIMMLATREEAWKLGLQEGLNRGRERSNEGNGFVECIDGPEEDALDDDDSLDETVSSTAFPARPPYFVPSNRPLSRAHPFPSPVPVQLPSNPPTVAHSVHPSENIQPLSIRSGYTRSPSMQGATPSPMPVPLPADPPSSQSIHPSENVRPMSIRSGNTRPPSRQRVSPSPSFIPSNTRPSSQYENIRPASTRPTTPRHIPGVIPPDNFIPSLGPDNRIRIPPPHEFSRAVMTPERPASPQLPAMSDSSQETLMVPGPRAKIPQQHRKRYHRRHSSSESSSSFSNLDIINDRPSIGIGIGTPMSIIPEVLSAHSTVSQLPDGDYHARHQRSFSENSMRTLNTNNSQHMESQTHIRPHSRSSYAGSTRNDRRQAESHSSTSHASSLPKISVQPPSRPASMGQSSKASQSFSHNTALPTVLETQGPSSTSVPGGWHSIVDPSLSPMHSGRYTNSYTANDDATVSSGLGTDPLTTPPTKGLVSLQPDWSGASASAAHVPLLPSNSLTGPVVGALISSNTDAVMNNGKKKGKGKKG